MKQRFLILLIALLLFSFCGCRPSGLHADSTTANTETTTPAPTREAHTQLEFFLEGMVEYQDATLFVGDGYSIYITDDGWMTAQEDGKTTWTSSYNPDITLTVIPNAGTDFDTAMDALFAGYTDVEVDGEYVYGHDEAYRYYRAARLIKTQDGILAAVWSYTIEATEGFGARLRVIAATLEATE